MLRQKLKLSLERLEILVNLSKNLIISISRKNLHFDKLSLKK